MISDLPLFGQPNKGSTLFMVNTHKQIENKYERIQ
jgi:hypothetical protein